VLEIEDDMGHIKKGFTEVVEALHDYYKSLLGVTTTLST